MNADALPPLCNEKGDRTFPDSSLRKVLSPFSLQSPLPQLQQHLLDAATLEQYQVDLDRLCDIFEVKVRATSARRVPQRVATVADALGELCEGTACGVQIRYRYAGRHWLDTLLRTAGGTRLTRICVDEQ